MKTKAFLSLSLFIGLISLSPFEEGVAGTLQDVKTRGKLICRRLLSAARELFARKGYIATTVREIVTSAGVTKPVL